MDYHELLTIQKFVYLLNDFYFEQFGAYLQQINAALPLKLVNEIKAKLPAFDTHEELCTKIYGSFSKNDRLKFNQLASHTFKQSFYISVNYPAYLAANYERLQVVLNNGDKEGALFLAKVLLDIAEKIEDFGTQVFVLKFLIQRSNLIKDYTQVISLTKKLDEALECERLINYLLATTRIDFNVSVQPNIEDADVDAYIKMLEGYYNHHSAAVRLVSKYAYISTVYYLKPEIVSRPEIIQKAIAEFDKELNNHLFVVFPLAFDLKSAYLYHKMNTPSPGKSDETAEQEFKILMDHSQLVKFWNSFLNIPQMAAITVLTSQYLESCHRFIHRNDYEQIVGEKRLAGIKMLIDSCKRLLAQEELIKYYRFDTINLTLLMNGLMVLSGKAGIKEGIEGLEGMLVSFQQVNLANLYDSIFVFLIIGYFAQGKYDKCADTYNRFKKLTRNKPVLVANGMDIATYYYVAQWLSSKSNQYLIKLQKLREKALADQIDAPVQSMNEMAEYFNIPLMDKVV